jgi:endonuclease/exonuclease/phosphatase family protein
LSIGKEIVNSDDKQKKNEGKIIIASFNAMRLGEKEKNYEIMAKVLSNFDLIGIEEVMHEKGLKKLKAHLIKLTGEKWEYIISENSVGSEGYREYYGYIYRKEKFQEVRKLGFYKEKNENEFMREPYGAYFKSGNFDFVYVICHSIFGDKETQRLIEASNYINVYEYFLKESGESDIIIAGDFNVPADSPAFRNLSERAGVSYLLSPGENPTTLSDERLVSSYDNFFINKEKTREFLENSGVYNFVKSDNYAIIKKYISDHLPIFSEYSIEYDLD